MTVDRRHRNVEYLRENSKSAHFDICATVTTDTQFDRNNSINLNVICRSLHQLNSTVQFQYLTFIQREREKKMLQKQKTRRPPSKVERFFEYFVTPSGRRLSFYLAGAGAFGLACANYLPHTVCLDYYRDFVQHYT